MTHPLENLFKPRSVAIIGASADPTKRGYRAITALHKGKYEGRIVPINPREKEILGHTCYAELTDVPGEIDVALVCTPAATTPAIALRPSHKPANVLSSTIPNTINTASARKFRRNRSVSTIDWPIWM